LTFCKTKTISVLAGIRLFDGNPFVQGAPSAVFLNTLLFLLMKFARAARKIFKALCSLHNFRKKSVSCFEDFPLRTNGCFLQNVFRKLKQTKKQSVSSLTARSRQHVNFPQRTR